jgi:D-threo-aldose 1-dehydrogenase
VHVAGVFGSGLLAESFSPSSSSPSSATYAYRPAQPDVAERARRWRELAAAHGHPLPAVAIAFAALPACVSRLVLGFSTPQQVDEGMAWVRQARRVGVAVWHDAKRLGLLSDGLPVPTVGPAEA